MKIIYGENYGFPVSFSKEYQKLVQDRYYKLIYFDRNSIEGRETVETVA